jgi:hypothetical protein
MAREMAKTLHVAITGVEIGGLAAVIARQR